MTYGCTVWHISPRYQREHKGLLKSVYVEKSPVFASNGDLLKMPLCRDALAE